MFEAIEARMPRTGLFLGGPLKRFFFQLATKGSVTVTNRLVAAGRYD